MKPIIDIYYTGDDTTTCYIELMAIFAGLELRRHKLSSEQLVSLFYETAATPHVIPWIEDKGLKIVNTHAEPYVIYAYMADHYMPKDQNFYPQDPRRRARIDKFLGIELYISYLTGIMFTPRLCGYDEQMPRTPNLLQDNLALLNHILMVQDRKYAICDELTLADTSMAISLCFIDTLGIDTSKFQTLSRYKNDLVKAITTMDSIKKRIVRSVQHCTKLTKEHPVDDKTVKELLKLLNRAIVSIDPLGIRKR